jgi:secreted Zn-dependent insulinase-like peptidase
MIYVRKIKPSYKWGGVVVTGALNDFREVPGLANLVAHMLVKGSKNYPGSFGFKKFLKICKGRAELPITRGDDQTFSFEVVTRLPDALRRQVSFFRQFYLN